MNYHSFFLFLAIVFFSFSSYSSLIDARVPVGSGAYTTDLPPNQKGPSDRKGNPVLPKVTETFSQAPMTNTWWSSLIWKHNPTNPWSENLFAYPFSAHAKNEGLAIGYVSEYKVSPYVETSKGYNSHEYHHHFKEDLLVGVVGMASPDTRVENYSDWAVESKWEGNGRTMNLTLGKGFPFIYVTIDGDAAQLKGKTSQIWYNQEGVIGLTVNQHHYGIFAPKGSSWESAGGTLTSTLNDENYFSIAILPDNQLQTLEFYRQHAYAFVTNTQVAWDYNEALGQLNTNFRVETILKEEGNGNVNRPLLALFPHQWLNTTDTLTPYSYKSPRGDLKVIDNTTFKTSYSFNGILPELPHLAVDGIDTFDSELLYDYVDSILKQDAKERWKNFKSADTYWGGKTLGRIARLVHIADQIGHKDAHTQLLMELKFRIQSWLLGTGSHLFYYDETWRSLIGYPASYGSQTELSDHHFHYGYFIMAAATIAQYDPKWASEDQWGGMINLLIRDVANWKREDSFFPFLRNFDPYEGHSWANGAALFGSGNNQESSSESMNFASGVLLWGAMTQNQSIRDLGIYLYTTETSAIEQYWFDVDNRIFPPEWKEPTVAILWGNGGAYALWWDGTIEEVHGINFLPITSGSLYLAKKPDYLRLNQQFMYDHGGTTGKWRDIHMNVRALYDPKAAISEFNQHADYAPEPGETKAHTYYWIHNLNTLGQVDNTVTADIPLYAVFTNQYQRIYIAYNPGDFPITVNFSDGKELIVPAKSYGSA